MTGRGSAAKWQQSGAGHLHRTMADIPTEVITRAAFLECRSRPDIILYRPKQTVRSTDGQWTTKPAEITLIEVKYTRDTDPTRSMRDPYGQHNKLYKTLEQRHPSACIDKKVIILGVAGTVFTYDTVSPLERMGVRGNHLKNTIHKLQRHAIQTLHSIWRSRQDKIRNGKHNTGDSDRSRTPPVEGWVAGGVYGGGWGDDRDEGARRREARGEG